MGRPARLMKKWEPKVWRPEYDRVVGYSFLGLGNEAVALRVGLGKQQVSNILNTAQAKILMLELQLKQKAQLEQSIPEALDQISRKAIERIHTVITDDAYFEKSPFAVVDRSIQVLKSVGHMKDGSAGNGGGVNNTTFNFNLPAEQSATLLDGLNKSKEARLLHADSELKKLIKGRDVTDIEKNSDAA